MILHATEGIGAHDRFLQGATDAKRLRGLQERLDKIMGNAPLQTTKYTEVVFGSRHAQGKRLPWTDDENRLLSPWQVRPSSSSNQGFGGDP